MQIAFLAIAGLSLLLALALLLWPLLGRPGQLTLAARADELRERLQLLKQAQADGLLDEEAFEIRRKALSDELTLLIDNPVSGRSRNAKITAGLLAAALPPLALLLYLGVGEPRALSFTADARPPSTPGQPGAEAQAPELAGAADQLRERLQANPEDTEGWLLLARTYRELARFGDARDAYARVRQARPEDLDVTVEYAESLGLAASPRSLLGEPQQLLAEVLQIEPNHQRGLWLMGFARTQEGDFAGALQLWEHLLTLMDDPDARNALRGQMNQARGRLGMDPLPDEGTALADAAPASAPATTSPPAPAAAASGPAIEVEVKLDAALAAQVGPGDTLFVFAKAENGPPMPLAVQRLPATELPLRLRLDDSMGMVEGMLLSRFPRVVVEARISRSGNAQAQPGDLQGSSGGIDNPPGAPVQVLIDRSL